MESPIIKLGNKAMFYSLPVAILGAFFKIMHFPYHNQMLIIGLSSVALAAILTYFPQKTTGAYLTGSAIAIGSIGILFKIMHWPYNGILIDIAILIAVIMGVKTIFFPGDNKAE